MIAVSSSRYGDESPETPEVTPCLSFTISVGNLPPGKAVRLDRCLASLLPCEDGEVTFHFPLVVAPRNPSARSRP
jgi:hypothetical protein